MDIKKTCTACLNTYTLNRLNFYLRTIKQKNIKGELKVYYSWRSVCIKCHILKTKFNKLKREKMKTYKDLVKGNKFTCFSINSMAMTSKVEGVVDRVEENKIVFKYKGKRKLFQIKLNGEQLIFPGHDLEVKADSDGNCFMGNACLNLVTEMTNEELIEYIDKNKLENINDNFKAHILNMTREEANNTDRLENLSNVVYPKMNSFSSLLDTIKSR